MNILIYNWTPLDIPSEGGGVGVYLRNLLTYFTENVKTVNITVLTSGYYYLSKNKPAYIRREGDYCGYAVYSIVNSPMFAPLRYNVSNIKNEEAANIVTDLLDDFVAQMGPFDAIHFQTFEGLHPKVLSLKEKYPQTRFIHSIHDYGIICSNVRLWNANNESCLYSKDKFRCKSCLSYFLDTDIEILKTYRPSSSNSKEHIVYRLKRKIENTFARKRGQRNNLTNRDFESYRSLTLEYINKYSDLELCVSERVAEIVVAEGVDVSKVRVDYIGTKVAENVCMTNMTDVHSDVFTMLFMGYGLVEKGFYQFVDVLESDELNNKKHIRVKFASKIDDAEVQGRLMALKEQYSDIIIYDGYTHDDFSEIMDGVNIGIVPPLWEDNLPQVAIEMVASGIPILVSSNGGAKELNAHPSFCFLDSRDFMQKINMIMTNRNLLEEYWKYSKELTTMERHVNSLLMNYSL